MCRTSCHLQENQEMRQTAAIVWFFIRTLLDQNTEVPGSRSPQAAPQWRPAASHRHQRCLDVRVAVDECQAEAAAHNTHRGEKKNNSNIYLLTSTKLMEGKKQLKQNSFTGWEVQTSLV